MAHWNITLRIRGSSTTFFANLFPLLVVFLTLAPLSPDTLFSWSTSFLDTSFSWQYCSWNRLILHLKTCVSSYLLLLTSLSLSLSVRLSLPSHLLFLASLSLATHPSSQHIFLHMIFVLSMYSHRLAQRHRQLHIGHRWTPPVPPYIDIETHFHCKKEAVFCAIPSPPPTYTYLHIKHFVWQGQVFQLLPALLMMLLLLLLMFQIWINLTNCCDSHIARIAVWLR